MYVGVIVKCRIKKADTGFGQGGYIILTKSINQQYRRNYYCITHLGKDKGNLRLMCISTSENIVLLDLFIHLILHSLGFFIFI